MNCEHLQKGVCKLGLYGGEPSPGTCRRCNERTPPAGPTPPQHVTRRPPADMSCRHRGELTGEAECKTCDGTMAKLYACTIHGTCTMFSKPIEGAKACGGCGDRLANG